MSEIRYITVPPLLDVTIETIQGVKTEPAPFVFFLKSRVEDQGAFGQGLDGVLMAVAIRQAFMASKPGDVIGIQLAEWEALCKSTRTPSGGYNPVVMMQLVPYARAILDATTTNPAEHLLGKTVHDANPALREVPAVAAE